MGQACWYVTTALFKLNRFSEVPKAAARGSDAFGTFSKLLGQNRIDSASWSKKQTTESLRRNIDLDCSRLLRMKGLAAEKLGDWNATYVD
jgi:hypothetical protein